MSIPPDYKGCLVARLMATVPAKCAAQTPPFVVPSTAIRGNIAGLTGGGYAIGVVKAGGSRRFTTVPIGEPRLDLHIFGPNGGEAMRLWRVVDSILDLGGFTAAGCRVYGVFPEVEPIELVDPGGEGADGWDKVVVPVIVRYSRVAVA